jgi:hypothetical protein
LAETYQNHPQQAEIHQAFADADLYNKLLFFFEYHPYHNVLHQKVHAIFDSALDRNHDATVNYLLYQTSLFKRILETSKDFSCNSNQSSSNNGGFHTFKGTSGNRVAKGFLIYMRKIANKLNEMQKANEEIGSFLESIPEWGQYFENELTKVNEVESKPLG